LPLEKHLRIYVAPILCFASVGPPAEPVITTTEFRTSRCKVHQIDIHYEICEWDMHRLLCQYRRQNLNLEGRHPWSSLLTTRQHVEPSSGVFHQAGVLPPWHVSPLPFSVSERAVAVATGTCTTNGWYLARFPFPSVSFCRH
jgi:hypothetical protein